MFDRLNNLNTAILDFMTRNIAKIVGLVGLGLVALFYVTYTQYDMPTNAKEFAKTSVKIVNKRLTSGGSGVILESTSSGSKILTNKHVCRLIEDGGYVLDLKGQEFQIKEYKKYSKHDLCMVKVAYDMGVNTVVATFRPDYFSKAFISGHPALMPPVLTTGNFSGREIIRLVTGFRKCTKKDRKKYTLYCILLGGVPVIELFESQLVTGTIMPGSSGSGVFDSDGAIGGLVFAGRSKELSYAYIVPHEYIADFVQNEDNYKWVSTIKKTSKREMIRRLFKLKDVCINPEARMRRLCEFVRHPLIWRRY